MLKLKTCAIVGSLTAVMLMLGIALAVPLAWLLVQQLRGLTPSPTTAVSPPQSSPARADTERVPPPPPTDLDPPAATGIAPPGSPPAISLPALPSGPSQNFALQNTGPSWGTLRGHKGNVAAALFLPDGRTLVTADTEQL